MLKLEFLDGSEEGSLNDLPNVQDPSRVEEVVGSQLDGVRDELKINVKNPEEGFNKVDHSVGEQ